MMWTEWLERLKRFLGEDAEEGLTGRSATLEQANAFFDTYRLTDLFPYEAYDEGTQVFVNTDSVGAVIECVPLCGADDSISNDIETILQDICPEYTYVQFLLWADPCVDHLLGRWRAQREAASFSRKSGEFSGPLLQRLAQKRQSFFEGLATKEGQTPPRDFRCMITFSVPRTEELSPDIERASRLKERLLNVLSQHTEAVAWTAAMFVKTMTDIVYRRPGTSSYYKEWDPLTLLGPQLHIPGYKHHVRKEGVSFNEEVDFSSLTVTGYPRAWTLASMGKLLGDFLNDQARINAPFYLHYGIYVPPQEEETNAFFKRIVMVEHQGRSENLLKIVPGLKKEVRDYGFAREQLHEGKRLLKTHLSMGIFAPPNEKGAVIQTAKSLFKRNGWRLEESVYTHFPHFVSSLPFMWYSGWIEDFQRKGLYLKTSLSNEAGNLAPLQGEWKGTKTPGMLLTGRKGQLFTWHAFDNDSGNYNTVVVGRSGAGKSVFMQDLLVSTLGVGGRVFVMDVGRSFEKSCKLLEGQFIEFALNNPLCLNPFTRIPLDDARAQEETFSMLKPIVSLMAAPSASPSDYEMSLLEKALKAAWDKKKQTATITDVAAWLSQQEDQAAKRLGVMLAPYSKGGVYGRYFEGDNNIDFTNPMVVIELEELKEKKDLQSVVLQMFMMSITNQMFLGDRRTPFHICIDEAWDLLRGHQTGLFIETLARRLRKYNGSLVIGTQSVNDFYQTPGALAAFENSDWMCLLSQKKESIEALKESKRLSLEAPMEAALKSVTTRHGAYSEVMIYNSSYGYAIGRLQLDAFSNLLYSTKADEYAAVQSLLEKGVPMADALERMAEERGAALKKKAPYHHKEKTKKEADR